MIEIGVLAKAEKRREELKKDVEAFLKSGGKIQFVKMGETREQKKPYGAAGSKFK